MEMPTPRPRGRPRSFDEDVALERAMQLFWRQGYEGTSIAHLTEAMGISPPSLYAAFGDKETLFLKAIERYQCATGGMLARLEQTAVPRDAVRAMLETAAAEMCCPERPPGCMVVTSALATSEASTRLQGELRRRRCDLEARIRARLREAARDGTLPTGTTAAGLAKFFAAVLQGMTVQARDGASRGELLAIARAAMRSWPEA